MEKVVEVLIGIPCSGKSTYLSNTYKEDDVFVISMDNIRYEYAKKMDWTYDEFFKRPSEIDIETGRKHSKYGLITKNNNWEHVEYANEAMHKDFRASIRKSHNALKEGKRVVIDMTNLTKKDRKTVKKWFKDLEDISFEAKVFNFEDNLSLIKSQNKIRGKKENKEIPDSVIDMMIKRFNPVDLDEGFSKIELIDGLKDLKENLKNKPLKPKRTGISRQRY